MMSAVKNGQDGQNQVVRVLVCKQTGDKAKECPLEVQLLFTAIGSNGHTQDQAISAAQQLHFRAGPPLKHRLDDEHPDSATSGLSCFFPCLRRVPWKKVTQETHFFTSTVQSEDALCQDKCPNSQENSPQVNAHPLLSLLHWKVHVDASFEIRHPAMMIIFKEDFVFFFFFF